MSKPTVTPEDIAKAREFLLKWFTDDTRLREALASFRAAARAEGEKRGLERAAEWHEAWMLEIEKTALRLERGEIQGHAGRYRDYKGPHVDAAKALRALAAEEGGERG